MSDYLAAQTTISFDYDSTLDVVTKEGQRLGLASSGEVTLSRPDKLRATRTGGFADVEMVFDGTTLSLLGKNVNAYAQVEAPGSVDQLIDTLRDTYDRPLPAADLLLTNINDALMPLRHRRQGPRQRRHRRGGMRSPRLPDGGGRLADLDRPRRQALSLPLRYHKQPGRRIPAILDRRQRLEKRRRGCGRGFRLRPARRR